MYEAYKKDVAYNKLVEISNELDHLLNQLATVNQVKQKK